MPSVFENIFIVSFKIYSQFVFFVIAYCLHFLHPELVLLLYLLAGYVSKFPVAGFKHRLKMNLYIHAQTLRVCVTRTFLE